MIDLLNCERRGREAVRAFWVTREAARQRQSESGTVDKGERAGVTAGQNMDGLIEFIGDVISANGSASMSVLRERSVVVLPGFFRPTKRWDVVVTDGDRLVAALEFKSQVGPSFGNNFNNRAEEAIGAAHDLWTAYREGAFGEQPRPFVGWLVLVEDAEGSRRSVSDAVSHFPVFREFEGSSYADRYNILCRKLVQERLYSAASVLMSPRSAESDGIYTEMSEMTGLRTFVAGLAGHVAAEKARARP